MPSDPDTATFEVSLSLPLWNKWKETVPDGQTPENRVIDLIEEDTDE